jgi:hypothetical protein
MTAENYMKSILALTHNKRVIAWVVLFATIAWFVLSLGFWFYLKREVYSVDEELERLKAAKTESTSLLDVDTLRMR